MKQTDVVELPSFRWDQVPDAAVQAEMTDALESGSVISMPGMGFPMSEAELRLLDPRILAKAKNVSYSPATGEVGGTSCTGAEAQVLKEVMARYSGMAHELLIHLFPTYKGAVKVRRTSLRPAEVAGRHSSWRKDDTLLHVDAFPSQPTHGERIIRIFCNVNPSGRPRLWRVGEPFETVARRFIGRIGRPFPGSALAMRAFGLTKTMRSEYDHIMLHLHDAMKSDPEYQKSVGTTPVPFQAGTTWIVYSDSVSHGALSGQHQFEQTFYLPLAGMKDVNKSPLRILERLRGRALA
jgi:3-deoxy-D-manno-oct-2-ulosonic acid (Kdo) hydroxylase